MTGVHTFNRLEHILFGGHDDIHFHLHLELHDVDDTHIRRVGHRNRQRNALHVPFVFGFQDKQRHNLVSLAQIFGKKGIGIRIDDEVLEPYIRDLELHRQDFD